MKTPETIKFDDLEFPVSDLFKDRHRQGVAPTSWTRVTFKVPDPFNATAAVETWLQVNCPGGWKAYHYTDPRSKNHERIMVVRFEDRNDALFFKLRGGHQSWEGE